MPLVGDMLAQLTFLEFNGSAAWFFGFSYPPYLMVSQNKSSCSDKDFGRVRWPAYRVLAVLRFISQVL